ncbi:MAG: energy-coupling factor ABC transporter permease [Bacillus subtilis]|nr:energy-coupling factor ABC transporter permease [Bacillus subtilis]
MLVWWTAAVILIGISIWLIRSEQRPDRRKITLAAFCTAAAFAIFQVSIPLFGGVHLNLTPLIGILRRPGSGIPCGMLIINILSSAIGHGGWGLIGANTLVNIVEVSMGYATFRLLKPIIPDLFSRAGIATIFGLLCRQYRYDTHYYHIRRAGCEPEHRSDPDLALSLLLR